jgi:hypothetical protein
VCLPFLLFLTVRRHGRVSSRRYTSSRAESRGETERGRKSGWRKEDVEERYEEVGKGKGTFDCAMNSGMAISYVDFAGVAHTTSATLCGQHNRARRTRKISQSGPSRAKRRKEKLPQRNLPISIRHPKAKRKICRSYQWTTVTIRRL